jgi:hypothetical protein
VGGWGLGAGGMGAGGMDIRSWRRGRGGAGVGGGLAPPLSAHIQGTGRGTPPIIIHCHGPFPPTFQMCTYTPVTPAAQHSTAQHSTAQHSTAHTWPTHPSSRFLPPHLPPMLFSLLPVGLLPPPPPRPCLRLPPP